MDVFEFLCELRGINGDGPHDDGKAYTAAELNVLMRANPDWGREQRAWVEHIWRVPQRDVTEAWIETLIAAARLLSDLTGGPVPFVAPREMVEASANLRRQDDGALLIGKAVQRSIAAQVGSQAQITNEAVLEEIRQLFQGQPAPATPPGSRWLSTKDIATRLSIDPVTAARYCKKGLIDASKTASGQWRTTEDRLRRSPFLNGRTRRKQGRVHGKLE